MNPSVTNATRQHGFSLIELMVSLTIGLVVVVAALSAYLGASGASLSSDAQTRMNEDAQAALTLLSQQLRMAGNNPKQPNRIDSSTSTLSSLRNPVYSPAPTIVGLTITPATATVSNFFIRGCDGRFANITTAANLDNLTCDGTTTTLPDSIAVSYEADAYNTIPTISGQPTDCLGNTLTVITAAGMPVYSTTTNTITTADITYTVADNRFYIGTSTVITTPSLYCKGNGGSAQPLVENIEDLQITYGSLNPGSTATTIAGYIDARDVVNSAPMAALASDGDRWYQVVTARICVVVRSDKPVAPSADSARYHNCQGELVNPGDRYLRKAYTTTVGLRN